jgi:hexosyltransferase
MKKKILFVVQRYGLEVNGGSEAYCRQVAEKLSEMYDVSVLTTCAEDYVTWKNEYNEGTEIINNVTVIRKKVKKPRSQKEFLEIMEKLNNEKENIELGEKWEEAQGPYSPDLINFLEENKNNYECFIFMTYLYYSTYFGIKIAPQKSILIPTAHDEPTIYYKIFEEVFKVPKTILYLTETEKRFVQNKFKNENIYSDVIGVGIDINENIPDIDLKEKFGIKDDYMVYIGRIDESKGCKEMFEYFKKYKKIYKNNLKLVLAGKKTMEIPKNEDIIELGFISETEKINLLKKCKLLVLPSQYESLSLSTLEAMYFSKPVLLNGKCEVLKDHVILSNGGLYYESKWEFIETLDYLIRNFKIAEKMGENGREYVDENYQWNRVIKKIQKKIN